jgi:hypothetical protein
VTAVTSPLFFTVRYDGKTAPLVARPAPTVVPTTQAKTDNKSRSTTEFGLGRNRKLRLAQPPDLASTSVSGVIASSPDPGLGLKRSLRLARPWARTDRASRGYIITLSLASSGYKEQDRRPIWLTPVTGNDGAPRATMTPVALSPLRQQGDVSRILAALPAMLLQGSGASPMATLSRVQGSSSPPTATLLCTQGLDISLPDTLAHSYTPIVRLDPLLASIKGRSRAILEGGSRGEGANEHALSLSHSLS